MTDSESNFGLERSLNIIKSDPPAFQISLTLLVLIIGIFIGMNFFRPGDGFGVNIFTELLSIAVTVGIIDVINQVRDQRRRRRGRKERLIQQMGSYVHNTIALNAVQEIIDEGWHKDGSLKSQKFMNALLNGAPLAGADLNNAYLFGANLSNANLVFANFHKANLQQVDLTNALLGQANLSEARLESCLLDNTNLIGADLSHTDLTTVETFNPANKSLQKTKLVGANLSFCDLSNLIFRNADLHGADLSNANLTNARLDRTDLRGCNLKHANLKGVLVTDIVCDENTILPDGSNWKPDSNFHRNSIHWFVEIVDSEE